MQELRRKRQGKAKKRKLEDHHGAQDAKQGLKGKEQVYEFFASAITVHAADQDSTTSRACRLPLLTL